MFLSVHSTIYTCHMYKALCSIIELTSKYTIVYRFLRRAGVFLKAVVKGETSGEAPVAPESINSLIAANQWFRTFVVK